MIFVQNSILNCVYHKRPKYKMSTPLHAIFIVVFGNVDFVLVISIILGRKRRVSESSQNSISEKSIFGQLEVIFLNILVLSRAGGGAFSF